MNDALVVKISMDSIDEITKVSLLNMYKNISEQIANYKEPASDYDRENYEYNMALLESLKVVINYITIEDERPY